MKKHKSSKAKNQTYHFKKRCDERLGIQVDRKSIQQRIKNQKYDENFYLLNKQSNRVTRYRYKFQDKWYIIPYDKNTHKVITIFEDRKQDIILKTESQNKDNHLSSKFLKLLKKIVQYFRNSKRIYCIISSVFKRCRIKL